MRSLAKELADLDSVAIVVHGVGDHSDVEIIKAATGATGTAYEIEYSGLELPGRLSTDAPKFLRIESSGKSYLILPIVWSNFRTRAAHWADQLSSSHSLQVLSVAAPALILLILDFFRCVPKARGWWKLGMGTVAFAVLALAGLVAWGAFWLLNTISFWFMTLEAMLDGVVREMAIKAPRARILVVGHSLGSVLVSHWAASISQDHPAHGRIILLTLGSPLGLMPRIFSRLLQSPKALLDSFHGSKALFFWANLWRDSDIIGRRLLPGSAPDFLEASIGPGPHANYWADNHLWIKVHSLLEIEERADLVKLSQDWNSQPLTPEECHELHKYRQEVKSYRWPVIVLSFISLSITSQGSIMSTLSSIPNLQGQIAYSTLWIVVCCLTVVFIATTKYGLQIQPERVWLEELRFMRGFYRLLAVFTLLGAGAIFLLVDRLTA